MGRISKHKTKKRIKEVIKVPDSNDSHDARTDQAMTKLRKDGLIPDINFEQCFLQPFAAFKREVESYNLPQKQADALLQTTIDECERSLLRITEKNRRNLANRRNFPNKEKFRQFLEKQRERFGDPVPYDIDVWFNETEADKIINY